MKKKYFLTLLLSLTLFVTQKSWACDLLAIDIGSDKSTIENIFGTIDEESMDNTSSQGEPVGTLKSGDSKVTGPVSVYIAEKNSFCEDIDFGEVLIKGYVVNNKVGAVEIEVQNGSNNDESNKGLLNQYVQANFGAIDTEKNWAGYKYWTIGEKKIYYYKIKSNTGEIIEGVAVTSQNYSDVLIEGEY